jgi:hypothetical protein
MAYPLAQGWQRHWIWVLAVIVMMMANGAQARAVSVFVSILPQKYFVERIAGSQAGSFRNGRSGRQPRDV